MKTKTDWLEKLIVLFDNQELNEVMLSASGKLTLTKNQIFHEKKAITPEVSFTEKVQEFAFSQNLRLDPHCPFAGGKIQGGKFRWHAVIPPVAEEARFFLRRHIFQSLTLDDFNFAPGTYGKIQEILEKKNPFLIAGPTGSGKTSLLSCMLSKFKKQKVIILEDYDEIPMQSDHWFKLLAKKQDIEGRSSFSQQDLFREALRMRPDHLVLGELRGSELRTFLETCVSGHSMTCSTIHASSVTQLQKRLQLMFDEKHQILEGFELWTILMARSQGQPLVKSVKKVIL